MDNPEKQATLDTRQQKEEKQRKNMYFFFNMIYKKCNIMKT